MKRAIVLYPSFNNIDVINKIRDKFDPNSKYLAPHLTVVFPFDSNISNDDLKAHMEQSLIGFRSFNIMLNEFTGDFRDRYLYLNVKKGNDEIIELHDKLYNGLLSPYLFKKLTFNPHVTVGRLSDQSEFDSAIDEISRLDEIFESKIDKISVLNIDDLENTTVEMIFELL